MCSIIALGHHALWKNDDVCLQDLGPSNLMFRTIDGQNFGVLNDWDRSVVRNKSLDVGEHTTTNPFLAADLLDDDS
jgi:hypothetical protein